MARVLNFTALSAVTGTGASVIKSTFGSDNITMIVTATGVTAGATIVLEGTIDGTNFYTIDTNVVSGNGTTITNDQEFHLQVRANLTSFTDGTYTVTIIGNAKGGVV